MDTKTFYPALQKIAPEPKTINIPHAYAVQSARWWPLLVLFSTFCVLSGCQRRFPEPGEPIIEQQDDKAAPVDRTESLAANILGE